MKIEAVKSQYRTTQRIHSATQGHTTPHSAYTEPHSATQRHTTPHSATHTASPLSSSHLVRADKAPYGAGEGGGVVCLGRGERRK